MIRPEKTKTEINYARNNNSGHRVDTDIKEDG